MATGLYWCLVLTECLSLVVVSTASFTQTTPPDSIPVCPGGRLVFTCTTSAGGFLATIQWIGDYGSTVTLTSGSSPNTAGSYNVTIEQVGNTLVSNATIEPVPVELNGTTISCSGDGGHNYNTLTVTVAGNIYNSKLSQLAEDIL